MYNVPSGYIEAVQSNLRDMRNVTVKVGGNTYTGSGVRGLTVHECVSDNQDRLLPGCAACASIDTRVVGVLPETVIGEELTASVGITLADGTVFTVPLGVFVIKDIRRQPGSSVTQLIGYDRMSYLDGVDFTMRSDIVDSDTSTKWMTFKSLLNAIVPFDNSGKIKWASVPDTSDYLINRPLDELHGYSCKELIGHIAGAHGKFARFNREGLLEFAWYERTDVVIPPEATKHGGLTLRSRKDVTDVVRVYSNDNIFAAGYGDYTNDLISNSFATNAIIIASTTCTPGSLEYRGDPAIQAGDIVKVISRDGDDRYFAMSDHVLTFSGGLSGSAESHGSEYHAFHSLNSTQRDIARLKRGYSNIVEAEQK